MAHEFDGKKYEKASSHQKEWGAKLISELSLKGNECVLDLDCGDGNNTALIAELVPNGKVVGMVPDKKHPTNRGIQCIKGLNAHEPIYVDRLTKVLVRKDMSDPLRGHVSATKGRFDDSVFQEMPYEES